MVHGSFEPKPKICDDFNEQNPECSKNSIEKKLKEFFVKDKRGEDPRLRYYANEDALAQLEEHFAGGLNNEELVELARTRLDPILLEIKLAQQEEEEIKRREIVERDKEK